MLHWNAACGHNESVVARLREMYTIGDYHSMPAEATRLREQGLTPVQSLVVDVNLAMGNFERGAITFAETRAVFEDLLERVRQLMEGEDRDVFLSEVLFLFIHVADKAGEVDLRDRLRDNFFEEINVRCAHAVAEFFIIDGVLAYRQGNLALALVYFQQGLNAFDRSEDDPCAHEVAARYLAKVYAELGMHDDARRTLTSVGLPVDDVPMRDLLRVPII